MRPATIVGLALGVAAILGCSGPAEPSPSSPIEGFDLVWETFDQRYPYFGLKQVDWSQARATYRPQASLASDVNALNDVLLRMLAGLRDLHVTLESPQGQRLATFQSPYVRNFDQSQWTRTVLAGGWRQLRLNLGVARIDGVPYIAIGSWNSTQFDIPDLDGALEIFRSDSVLIIDVRPNGGGDDRLAFAFAGRFTDRTVLTEIVRVRSGPLHTDFGPEIRRTVGPRGPWTFRGRVFVLSGRGALSSNESFVTAMRELPQVTVVGDTTGGATANPVARPYLNGWKVWVSTWYATTPDGAPIEGRGIPPDIVVPFSAIEDRDPVISAAVALARKP